MGLFLMVCIFYLRKAPAGAQSALCKIVVYFVLSAATTRRIAIAQGDTNLEARRQEVAAEREARTGLTFFRLGSG